MDHTKSADASYVSNDRFRLGVLGPIQAESVFVLRTAQCQMSDVCYIAGAKITCIRKFQCFSHKCNTIGYIIL